VSDTTYAPTYPGDVLTLTVDVEDTMIYWPLNLQADGADAGPVVVDDSPTSLCDDCGRLVPAGHGQTWPPFWVCYDCHPKRDDSPAALIARLTAGDRQ